MIVIETSNNSDPLVMTEATRIKTKYQKEKEHSIFYAEMTRLTSRAYIHNLYKPSKDIVDFIYNIYKPEPSPH